MNFKPEFSLGICIPVWNRGPIFAIAFKSLMSQLEGIRSTIWIFDNGSDQETKDIIHSITGNERHEVHKVFLPKNMGIPYVANVFARAIQENCDYVGYQSPQYIMLMDADAYFKEPVIDLLSVFTTNYGVGMVSGHDSIEHAAVKEGVWLINNKDIKIREKTNERMLTMVMRKEEFLLNYPFPHYRNRDVDWEITQWNPNSLLKRNRKLVVFPGYVLHLGINISTWDSSGHQVENPEEMEEVRKILEAGGLILPEEIIPGVEVNADITVNRDIEVNTDIGVNADIENSVQGETKDR
jgi:glycosyltransferase involved in cell wall biosynthesis